MNRIGTIGDAPPGVIPQRDRPAKAAMNRRTPKAVATLRIRGVRRESVLECGDSSPLSRLRHDRVDVWRASLDEQRPAFVRFANTVLSADEAERARRFHFEHDRRRFVVGRAILRVILGNYLGRPPEEIAFEYGENDKPVLDGRDGVEIQFNVAHSDALALFAVTRVGEIGIDVERVRDVPEWEAIAAHYFDAAEISRLRACTAPQRAEEFFRAWTRHEALIKARGEGLGTAARTGSFSVHPLEVAPGFAGALAVGPAAHWVSNIAWQGRAADGLAIARHAAPTRLKTPESNPISA